MAAIPTFPKFRKVVLDDRHWYDEFYRHFPNYADFAFNNLIIWQDQHDDLEISRIGDVVILRCTSLYMKNRLMFNFIGDGDYDDVIQKIFDHQTANKESREILGVPEYIVKQLKDPGKYDIEDDRDQYEYIMDTRLLGTLEGHSMKRLRQTINGYERDHQPITVKELDLKSAENVDFLRFQVLAWDKAFSTNDTAEQEKEVLLRTLNVVDTLDYKNISLFVGKDLAGFALWRRLPSIENNYAVVNHLKTSYKYPHTSYYLSHRIAQTMQEHGIDYMNYEQDLGIEGLRYFKEKLKPDHLLKKFNISIL